jgi:hypothetical protein
LRIAAGLSNESVLCLCTADTCNQQLGKALFATAAAAAGGGGGDMLVVKTRRERDQETGRLASSSSNELVRFLICYS